MKLQFWRCIRNVGALLFPVTRSGQYLSLLNSTVGLPKKKSCNLFSIKERVSQLQKQLCTVPGYCYFAKLSTSKLSHMEFH